MHTLFVMHLHLWRDTSTLTKYINILYLYIELCCFSLWKIILCTQFAVPVPEVNISSSHNAPLYTGIAFTLTCTATLHFNVCTEEEVTATWSGPRNITGERYTLSHVKLSGGINISLTISPLTVQDEGLYTCTATVDDGNNISQLTTASDTVWISIYSK